MVIDAVETGKDVYVEKPLAHRASRRASASSTRCGASLKLAIAASPRPLSTFVRDKWYRVQLPESARGRRASRVSISPAFPPEMCLRFPPNRNKPRERRFRE